MVWVTWPSLTQRRSCSFAEYWKHFMSRYNDVHGPAITPPEVNGFGWNLGYSWVYCLELALTDFWRNLRRSKSRRASRNFVFFCQVNNHDFTDFRSAKFREMRMQYGHRCTSVSSWILSENIFENLPLRGLFFQKAQRLPENCQRLPTSGCNICEMNTNCGKSRPVGMPTECWLSICTVGINLSHSSGLQAAYKKRHSWTSLALPSSTPDVMSQSHSRGGANKLTLTLHCC